MLTAVTCAPISRTRRGIPSEVEVGPDEGLPAISVISCDSLVTVPTQLLDLRARAGLDEALRYALDIQY